MVPANYLTGRKTEHPHQAGCEERGKPVLLVMVCSLVPKTRKGSSSMTVSLQKHERFHNSKLWPEDDKLWVWTCSGARPSGSHGTSLTFLKHLQSTSRQVISSNSQRFSFLVVCVGGLSYISFSLSLPPHTHTPANCKKNPILFNIRTYQVN